MIKKNFLLFACLMIFVGGTTSADPFELTGPGIQIYEDELTGDEIVRPGGVIRVFITNNRPGYQRFFLYIATEDAQGNEILLWGSYVAGTNCRPGTSCAIDVPNIPPQLGLSATELAVVGFFGTSASVAAIDHVTFNP